MGLIRKLEEIAYNPSTLWGSKNFLREFYKSYDASDADSSSKISLIKGVIKPEEEPSFQDPTDGLKGYEQLLLKYASKLNYLDMLFPRP